VAHGRAQSRQLELELVVLGAQRCELAAESRELALSVDEVDEPSHGIPFASGGVHARFA
jgi:hypothetical protein